MAKPSSTGSDRPAAPTPHSPVRVDARAAKSRRGPRIETYDDALRYLYERVDVERTRPSAVNQEVFKLDRMLRILDSLGNPQSSLRFVHVAGTKGKGSTCEMTAACLQACGYATGLYTSPHLVDVRERVRVAGEPIDKAAFTALMRRVGAAVIAADLGEVDATFFEIITALALAHFSEQAVDIAVMEVGLGGRLDCTNVILPEVCAVTTIALDHTQLLGDTVEKIAAEKAGIFKNGVPALTCRQTPEVLTILRERAAAVGAPLRVVGDDVEFSYRFEADAEHGPHCRVCLTTERSSYEHIPVPLKGEHQAINCGLALAILDTLASRGFHLPETSVGLGMRKTSGAGRLELVWQTPRVYVDGAHNPESVRCLVRTFGSHIKYDSMVLIFGCAADKDAAAMLRQIDLGADKVIFTRATGNARSANPTDLLRLFSELNEGKMAQATENLEQALAIAKRAVGRDDIVVVTGSFYLAGEAKRLLMERGL